MPRGLHRLTDLQLAILDHLWTRGEATVVEVHDAIGERQRIARKTVGTVLFRLEGQGLVKHRVEGREYVYAPEVSRNEVERVTVGKVLRNLFGGDVSAMVSHALEAEEVEPRDVERLRRLLERWDAESREE